MPTYDLTHEPWIPVRRKDGTNAELGLRDVLLQAHDLASIEDPSPVIEFGLHRLLTALVLDIFEVHRVSDLERLLDRGHFDPATVDGYFAQWCDRFCLFDPEHPFLQSSGMKGEAAKPLSALLPSIPSGTGANHFHHALEGEFAVSPAVAARMLTAISPFMTAGGAGLSPSVNGAPPWYALILGRNLFETLCLNVCALPLQPEPKGSNPPAWRSGRVPGGGRRDQWSLAEALTWRPRRIHLIPSEPGRCSVTGKESPLLIRTMKFAAGDSCDFAWRDPSVAYTVGTKDKTAAPRRPHEGREVWRDLGPLALLQEEDYTAPNGQVRFERPALVTQYAFLCQEGALPKGHCFEMAIYGMRTDMKMKVFEWFRERLALPSPLLWQRTFHREAQEAMDRADQAAYQLKQGIRKAHPTEGNKRKKPKRPPEILITLITAAQRQLWEALRDPYDRLLLSLADAPAEEALVALRDGWNETLRRTALRAFEDAVGDLDTDSDALRRQVEARTYFHFKLNDIFAPEAEKADRKQRSAARKAASAASTKGGPTR